jgi:hypothetical protein
MNSNSDRVKHHIIDTLTHKQFFSTACLRMIDYLYVCERFDDALELAKRCSLHDHSKFEDDEIKQFIQLPIEEYSIKTSREPLTPEQVKYIETHWKRNRHHPEFFSSPNNMSDIDIMEMVCDWFARSLQYGDDFMYYATVVARRRFGFNEETFAKVLSYCEALNKTK